MFPEEQALLRGLDDERLEALVEVLLIAAYADGEMSDEERKHFTESVGAITERRLGDERLSVLVGTLASELVREGRPMRLARLRAKIPEANVRKAALRLAVGVMAVDGILRTTERELILELAQSFGIGGEEAARLVRELEPALRPRALGARAWAGHGRGGLGRALSSRRSESRPCLLRGRGAWAPGANENAP